METIRYITYPSTILVRVLVKKAHALNFILAVMWERGLWMKLIDPLLPSSRLAIESCVIHLLISHIILRQYYKVLV